MCELQKLHNTVTLTEPSQILMLIDVPGLRVLSKIKSVSEIYHVYVPSYLFVGHVVLIGMIVCLCEG